MSFFDFSIASAVQIAANRLYKDRVYVAPTVYRLAGNTSASWKYYKTLAEAIQQYHYVAGDKGYTAATPAGTVNFTSSTAAQTLGVNVDFFIEIPIIGTMVVPYEVVRQYVAAGNFMIPFRFYKTDGSGPYYSVLINNSLGITATVLSNVPVAKIQAIDDYHRELQLLKSRYNTLAFYLNDLSKKTLKPAQQQSFNEGVLLLNNLRADITKIKGVDITYTESGQIGEVGFIPVIIILIIAITAVAIAWPVNTFLVEKAKIQKMNASYDMQKWIADQKLKLATALKAGSINQSEYNSQAESLDKADQTAQKAVLNVTQETPGTLDKLTNLALIGGGIFLISKFAK